jgi:hypothetical protein
VALTTVSNYALGAYIAIHELHSSAERPALLAVAVSLLLGGTGLLAIDKWIGRK